MTTFTVTGSGAFPLDMLRYDECWPATADDATYIGRSWARGTGRSRITLITHDRTAPARDRWESFGWQVVIES